jgi:ribosomal protein S18 acetylase RimI-like enzyme
MSFRIRRYRWSDLEAVSALHRIGLAQVGLAPGDGVYYDHDLPHIHQIYLGDRGEFLVGLIEGRVIAMGGLRRVDEHTAEVCRMRVHPEHQRRGYGTRVLIRLEERAAELGYRRLQCDTTVNQIAAIALYRRHGWRETARREVGGLTVVYFEKELGPAPDGPGLATANEHEPA